MMRNTIKRVIQVIFTITVPAVMTILVDKKVADLFPRDWFYAWVAILSAIALAGCVLLIAWFFEWLFFSEDEPEEESE